jgi:hypothetical protein
MRRPRPGRFVPRRGVATGFHRSSRRATVGIACVGWVYLAGHGQSRRPYALELVRLERVIGGSGAVWS